MADAPRFSKLTRLLLSCQAAYYLVTGIWPVISVRTFEAVTGPKTDGWLVRTVGLLAAVIGAAIGVAARRGQRTPELLVLAFGSALAFAAIDLVYALRGVISPIYLADAALQGTGVALLAWSLGREEE
jgi:hypothetical protein